VPIVWTSGSLNLLAHSGPVQACNGIVLPYYLSTKQFQTTQSKNKQRAKFWYISPLTDVA